MSETNNLTTLQELEEMLTRYKGQLNQEQSEEILSKVKEANLLIPVNFPQDESLAKIQEEMSKGAGKVKLPPEAKPVPVLIKNDKGNQFLAVYTSPQQIPKEQKHNGVIEMKFEGCINYSKDARHKVDGIVVNPFTHNFIMRVRKEQQVTVAQFHMLARKNIEYVIFPHSIYTGDKAYFDSISSEKLYKLMVDQYAGKVECPYTEEDFYVMQLGVTEQLDLIQISMPVQKIEAGLCLRIYVTWNKTSNIPGYYMITQDEEKDKRKFFYMNHQGELTDLGDAPVESAEMQNVIDRETKLADA